jgi:signal transduction histidine kinase
MGELNATVHRLSESPFFTDIPKERLPDIARIAQEKVVPPNTIIFQEGDPGDSFYIINSGKVRVFKKSREDIETDLAHLESGESFGEIALLTGEPRSGSVETLEETHLTVIAKDKFDQLLRDYPHVLFTFFKQLSGWLIRDDLRLEKEIQRQLEMLQDVSHLKTLERERANLISMLVHDMKSPLICLQGFIHRLLNKTSDLGEDIQKKYLEILKTEVGKLEFLINDFLEFSRSQAGMLELRFTAMSLDAELTELCQAYQPKALQCGVNLELRHEGALPIIQADANRLRRVFTNLLDNALKFSQEEGTITITTQETDHDVVVEIVDQGTGIDPNDLPYIFEPFRQGQGARQSEGYGMGLAVVKDIVEGHGGRILVESEPGEGSAFSVILPKA